MSTPPTYAAAFQCIGPACEDTCCAGWDIPVDKATFARYQLFPADRLGTLVSAFVTPNPPGAPDPLYATIHRTPTGDCPFFAADRLCNIQREFGPDLLSSTCSLFPRSLNRVGPALEGSLSVSCPEAARNILFEPGFLDRAGDLRAGGIRSDNVLHLAASNAVSYKPAAAFPAVRSLCIETIRDRSRPLRLRLLRIAFACKRLDKLRPADGEAAFASILRDLRDPAANAGLDAALLALPADPRLRLEVVLALSQQRAADPAAGNRFRDTFWTFIAGIGSDPTNPTPTLPPDPTATLPDDLARFLHAEHTLYHSFFAAAPAVLENFLLNDMNQHLFPFGLDGGAHTTPRSIFAECILLLTRFAWLNALLVGVAAAHPDTFSPDHVVRTVQSFTRATEHFPHVLDATILSVKDRGLDTVAGLAILLGS